MMTLASHAPLPVLPSLDSPATQSPKPLPDPPAISEHQRPQEKQLDKTDQDKQSMHKEKAAGKKEKQLSGGERAGKERRGRYDIDEAHAQYFNSEEIILKSPSQSMQAPLPREDIYLPYHTSHDSRNKTLYGQQSRNSLVVKSSESSPTLTREPSYAQNYSEEPARVSPTESHSRPSGRREVVSIPSSDSGKSWYAPSPRRESEQRRTQWYIPAWFAGMGAKSSTSISNPSSPLSPEREANQNEDSDAYSEESKLRDAEMRRTEMRRWEKMVKRVEEEMKRREREVEQKEEEMTGWVIEMGKKEEELKRGKEDVKQREEEMSRWERELRRQQEDIKQGKVEMEQREEELTRREEDIRKKEEEGQRKLLLMEKQIKVGASLNEIFRNVEQYRQLLSCSGDEAQKILDAFQLLLDTDNFQSRAQMIAAMRRLSQKTELYPTRFSLNGPVPALEDEAVSSGSYADVYKVLFQGEETCFNETCSETVTKVYAREAIVWGQLSHPNILPFYGISKFRSRISFVSRWAQNGNLVEYLTHNPDADRILLCHDVAAGVDYLHRNDIVHGDLKGLNVLVDSSGRACVGDFGLSSVTDSQIIRWASQSTIASRGGTRLWQVPELLDPVEDVDDKVYNSKASDVYAWASICYETFTGNLPFFETPNLATVRKKVMQGVTPTCPQPDDPAWLKHGLNDRIWSLMTDCWSLRPSERPDMATVISRLDGEKPDDPRPSGEWERRSSMSFRNAQDVNLPKDWIMFWDDLENLLSRIIPGI
ncbi:putative serine/threonine-protein kinase [Termitomyces sp. J132]|nr:putative serine/threonine-protein kinase [Termitomyces sp. J132]